MFRINLLIKIYGNGVICLLQFDYKRTFPFVSCHLCLSVNSVFFCLSCFSVYFDLSFKTQKGWKEQVLRNCKNYIKSCIYAPAYELLGTIGYHSLNSIKQNLQIIKPSKVSYEQLYKNHLFLTLQKCFEKMVYIAP